MVSAQWKFWIDDWKEIAPLTDYVSNIIRLCGEIIYERNAHQNLYHSRVPDIW